MRVAIYARVSTRQYQTTENQLLDLRSWTKENGHTIYKEFEDQISGGKSERAALKEMFLAAHQRKFDLLLFWSLDRFSREGARQTILYLQQLESYGIQFKSYTEQYLDSSGIFKDVIITLLATLAKQEKIRLSERVKSGMNRAREQGIKFGRPQLALASEIKKLVSEGLSDRAIGRQLNISHRSVAKYKL